MGLMKMYWLAFGCKRLDKRRVRERREKGKERDLERERERDRRKF